MGKKNVSRRKFLKLAGATAGSLLVSSGSHFAFGQSKKPLKFGVLLVSTGLFSSFGKRVYEAITYSANEINKKGGILGREIQLLREDTEVKADVAVTRAKKLITEDKVDFLMTGDSSSIALALAKIAVHEKKIFWNFDGTTDRLRGNQKAVQERTGIKYGGMENTPYMINIHHSAAQRSMAVANYIVKAKKPWKRIYNLSPDYEFGYDCWTSFSHELKRLRPEMEIVGSDFPSFGTTDWAGYITKISEAKPDGIFTSLWESDQITFLTQAKAYGLWKRVPAMLDGGATGHASAEAMGKEFIDNFYGSCEYDPTIPDTKGHRAFVENYHKTVGTYPNTAAYFGYIALQIAKQCMEKVGTSDAEAIIEGINGMTFPTPAGKWTIRKDRYAIPEFIVVGRFAPGRLPYATISSKDYVLVPGKEVTPPEA